MWKLVIPMLLVVAMGFGAFGSTGGSADWVVAVRSEPVPLDPRDALHLGGDFIHPVYTQPPITVHRRVLM